MPKALNPFAPKYPWRNMAIGDSFFTDTTANGYAVAATATRNHAPRVFLARKESNGFRVWRVA